MSEPLRKLEEFPAVPLARSPLADVPAPPAEVNDNEPLRQHVFGEIVGFEIPRSIWVAMVSCYVVFLAALLTATGGARAAFAIAVSGVYVAMFFGTARALLRQAPGQPRSALSVRGGKLRTLYGPLGRSEVAVQMLIVPGLVACFGIAVAIIRAVVA